MAKENFNMSPSWMAMLAISIIVLSFFIAGCGEESNEIVKPDIKDNQPKENDYKGLMLSGWYLSEEHGKDVIDFINYDNTPKKIYVETLCYDNMNNTVPTTDHETLVLPARNGDYIYPITWVPMCPPEGVSYSIDYREVSN